MKSVIKAFMIAAVAMVSVPAANATLIVFNDTTDTVSATLDGDPVPSCTQVQEGANFTCGVRLKNFPAAPVVKNYLAEFEIVEPANADEPKGTISDVVSFFVPLANPTDLFVFFFSDPIASEVLIGPFYNAAAPLEESGISQTITLPPDLPPVAIDLTVKFASDVSVPEPSSMVLLVSMLALGFLSFRMAAK
jgi:hypothetical protein